MEVINSMQQPSHFPRVVSLSTLLMGGAVAGIGAIGYWCASTMSPQRQLLILALHCHARHSQAHGGSFL